MKIGVLVDAKLAETGGANSFVNLVLKGLESCDVPRSVEIILIANSEIDFSSSIKSKFRIVSIPSSKISIIVKLLLRIESKISNYLYGSNLIHYSKVQQLKRSFIDNLNCDFIWSLTAISFPLDTPYATTIWDIEHLTKPHFPEVSVNAEWERRQFILNATLARAAAVFVGTETGKKQLINAFGLFEDRVFKVPFAATSSTFQNNPKRNSDMCFYPAQFWPHKNHLNLLFAFKQVSANSDRNLKLVLPGGDKGNLEKVRTAIQELKLDDCVLTPGYVEEDEIAELYKTCAFMIYPSLFGPDNIPPLEALAAGCPVLVADQPGAREQFGDLVEFFDALNPEDIAKSMTKGFNNQLACQNENYKLNEFLESISPSAVASEYLRVILTFRSQLVNWRELN